MNDKIYALTSSLMDSMRQNATIKDMAPFIVLNKSLGILGKSTCNCGGGAAGNKAKKSQEAYNMCKRNIVSMSDEDIAKLKKLAGVAHLEVAYTDNKGLRKTITI